MVLVGTFSRNNQAFWRHYEHLYLHFNYLFILFSLTFFIPEDHNDWLHRRDGTSIMKCPRMNSS